MENNIKKIRLEKNISRIELSRLSGIPYRTIEDWECKRRKPSDLKQLKSIADVFHCSIEELFVWNDEN